MKDIIFYMVVILFLGFILFNSINYYDECERKGGVVVKAKFSSKCIKAEVLE